MTLRVSGTHNPGVEDAGGISGGEGRLTPPQRLTAPLALVQAGADDAC